MYSADMRRLSCTPISCASRFMMPRSKARISSTTPMNASQIQTGMPSQSALKKSMWFRSKLWVK